MNHVHKGLSLHPTTELLSQLWLLLYYAQELKKGIGLDVHQQINHKNVSSVHNEILFSCEEK